LTVNTFSYADNLGRQLFCLSKELYEIADNKTHLAHGTSDYKYTSNIAIDDHSNFATL